MKRFFWVVLGTQQHSVQRWHEAVWCHRPWEWADGRRGGSESDSHRTLHPTVQGFHTVQEYRKERGVGNESMSTLKEYAVWLLLRMMEAFTVYLVFGDRELRTDSRTWCRKKMFYNRATPPPLYDFWNRSCPSCPGWPRTWAPPTQSYKYLRLQAQAFSSCWGLLLIHALSTAKEQLTFYRHSLWDSGLSPPLQSSVKLFSSLLLSSLVIPSLRFLATLAHSNSSTLRGNGKKTITFLLPHKQNQILKLLFGHLHPRPFFGTIKVKFPGRGRGYSTPLPGAEYSLTDLVLTI